MQQPGKPQFIHAHTGIVKGVAFSPKHRYIFCSGGTDGKVNVYNALQGQHMMSSRITSPHAMKNINAVKFNADGSRILSTTSRRLSVIDAERGELVCSYDNCTYVSKDNARTPLAADPQNANMAVCGCTNGKGLITFDFRKPQPACFALNAHSTQIKDIMYLDSWPFGDATSCQNTIASLSVDGVCKFRTIDNRELRAFDVGYRSSCFTATPGPFRAPGPEPPGKEPLDLEPSVMVIGGNELSVYYPIDRSSVMEQPRLFLFGPLSVEAPIQKLKYTSNGHLLYTIASEGHVRRYRRRRNYHDYIGEVYSHDDEVIDMDISPNDEYIVTASRDGSVGLMCLGAPSYGWTGYMQLL